MLYLHMSSVVISIVLALEPVWWIRTYYLRMQTNIDS